MQSDGTGEAGKVDHKGGFGRDESQLPANDTDKSGVPGAGRCGTFTRQPGEGVESQDRRGGTETGVKRVPETLRRLRCPAFAVEKLEEEEWVKISDETLGRRLIKEGRRQGKRKRKEHIGAAMRALRARITRYRLPKALYSQSGIKPHWNKNQPLLKISDNVPLIIQ
jgi:hypothetical protein